MTCFLNRTVQAFYNELAGHTCLGEPGGLPNGRFLGGVRAVDAETATCNSPPAIAGSDLKRRSLNRSHDSKMKWARWGSNPGPGDYESHALTD